MDSCFSAQLLDQKKPVVVVVLVVARHIDDGFVREGFSCPGDRSDTFVDVTGQHNDVRCGNRCRVRLELEQLQVQVGQDVQLHAITSKSSAGSNSLFSYSFSSQAKG